MSVFNGINHFALQGQEVFNTYGELANWQLLHMYGFATPSSSNHFDAVSGSHLQLTSFCCRFATWNSLYNVVCGWLGSRVVRVLESGTEGPGFKLQSWRCRVTLLGKLFTPIHQAAKLVAALLRVAGITGGLAESNGSLLPGLWLTSPAGWLPRTANPMLCNRVWATFLVSSVQCTMFWVVCYIASVKEAVLFLPGVCK